MTDILSDNTIFLLWHETTFELTGHRIISGLGTEPMFDPVQSPRWCRYSSEDTQQRREQALNWVVNERPDAKIMLVNETLNDGKKHAVELTAEEIKDGKNG